MDQRIPGVSHKPEIVPPAPIYKIRENTVCMADLANNLLKSLVTLRHGLEGMPADKTATAGVAVAVPDGILPRLLFDQGQTLHVLDKAYVEVSKLLEMFDISPAEAERPIEGRVSR